MPYQQTKNNNYHEKDNIFINNTTKHYNRYGTD